jgi:predicted ArsR family transcriptional regulator
MAKAKKNGSARILSALKSGPKKGLTREKLAAKAGLSVNSTGPYLSALKAQGQVQVVGKIENPRGRPTQLWGLA